MIILTILPEVDEAFRCGSGSRAADFVARVHRRLGRCSGRRTRPPGTARRAESGRIGAPSSLFGLVDGDELFRVEIELPLQPGFSSALQVLLAVLGCVGKLLLRVNGWRWKKRQSVPIQPLCRAL